MTEKPDADLDAIIDAHYDAWVALRHDLHAHPQLAYEETYASGRVRDELDAIGIPYQADIATTGVVGWIVNDDHRGDAIGLRADMDALPITEETGLPYASQTPGLMHACGHDGHTTVLLGAARVLHAIRDRLPCPVKLIFQPAEEGGAGAARMIEQDVLTDAIGGVAVGRMFGLHGINLLDVGQYGVRIGAFLAANASFHITLRGRGGHAALPHLVIDPVPAAAQLATALQTIVSRNVDPIESAVVTLTQLHAGSGGAVNVIPPAATLAGTIRTLKDDVAERITRRITELAESTAEAFGCTAEAVLKPGYPVTFNHQEPTETALAIARDVLGEANAITVPVPFMASEDFSFYSQQVPSCFGIIGVRPPGRKDYPGLHHPQYDFTDEALRVGVRLMCEYALRGE